MQIKWNYLKLQNRKQETGTNYKKKHYHTKKKEDVPHLNIKMSWKENIFPTIHNAMVS